MGRSGFVGLAIAMVSFIVLAGCGSSRPNTSPPPTPTSVSLSPSSDVSLDLGRNQLFSATANNASNTAITGATFTFSSSNTAVVTVSTAGRACAGTWDSLTNPQLCTPGQVGAAQITAVSNGVSSPPTTIYVHQHVDNVVVTPLTAPTTPCISKGSVVDYRATAFSQNADITHTVGTFTWKTLSTDVVTLSTTASGLSTGQVEVTANTPGITSIFASIGTVNSSPFTFITCPVQSIALEIADTSGNSFTTASGGSKTIVPTVLDSLGTTITDVPLTWSTSNSALVTATTGVAHASKPGGASITASCTPPTCNIGFLPTLPIYPPSAIAAAVTGTRQDTTIWVSSTDCLVADDCVTRAVPISTSGNIVGAGLTLTATPNSLEFDHAGTKAYLGTNRSLQGSKGLMVLDIAGSTVTQLPSTPGKVLAISPDGKKAIISDTADSPNQVFVFDTTSNSSTGLLINGATAAVFSPDGLKAYILANNGNAGTLYIYSALDALETISLGSPLSPQRGNDVSFLPDGGFAYIALASPTNASVSALATCHNPASPSLGTTALASTPLMIRSVADGSKVLALNATGIDVLVPSVTGDGCSYAHPYIPGTTTPLIPGSLAVSTTLQNPSIDFGQGTLAPTQFLLAPDGLHAYVVSSNLNRVLIFDTVNRTTSSIALANGAAPLQAAVTSDGGLIYVGASDGTVHVLDTIAEQDLQQVSFPEGLCASSNADHSYTCKPNLIAARP